MTTRITDQPTILVSYRQTITVGIKIIPLSAEWNRAMIYVCICNEAKEICIFKSEATSAESDVRFPRRTYVRKLESE